MIEVVLLVLAVAIGLGVVMRMDVSPREEPAVVPVREPAPADALTSEA